MVAWDWYTANLHNQVLLPIVEALESKSIVLADTGFNCADGIPSNLKWNVSSNVRQLGAVINEQIRLFCGYCGLLIQTSVGNGTSATFSCFSRAWNCNSGSPPQPLSEKRMDSTAVRENARYPLEASEAGTPENKLVRAVITC